MPTSTRRGPRTPRLLSTLLVAALASAGLVATAPQAAVAAPTPDYTQLVNPFMSTQDDNGQNLPGAQVPHGLAKPNPMTAPGRSQSGYDYKQSSIRGFTMTNLDGVGGSGAGGDLLVVPTYRTYSSRPDANTYALPFSHDDESAEPGYYQVGLQAPQGRINAELTATVRSGLERFTFPQAGQASLVLDVGNNFTGRTGSDLAVRTLADGRVGLSGRVGGTFNGYDYQLYYETVTSKPVAKVQTWGNGTGLGNATTRTGPDSGAVLTFDVAAGEAVQLTTTLSPISVAQARRDQAAELSGRTFDEVRAEAKQAWQDVLAKVAVTSDVTSDPTGDLATIFYTSLYRMLATPTNATSTDGTYRAVDGTVRRADGYTHYDGWGTWDDFRKFSVLATLYPDLYNDLTQSLVDIYADAAKVGNARLSSRTMAVPTVRFERSAVVIADAVAKGVSLDRLAQAYPALVANTTTYNAANEALGYLPGDPGTTVGSSYDDYALSVIAAKIGNTADATRYAQRSLNYRNVIKPGAWTAADGTAAGVLSPKAADGSWTAADLEQFEAARLYQGTLWQFTWYTAQDMAGLITAMGGTDATRKALSWYFGEQAPDDGTRMLKSNANEIDLQTPYLFNYVGQPAKTQKWVRDLYTKETWQNYIATGQTKGNNPSSSGGRLTPPLKTKVFKNAPDGFLPTMDDDTGAMSATFVAAALGLYPVTAGSSQYQVGSPFFPRVDITHDDGTAFSVTADGVSADSYYIQDATLDGKAYGNTWVDYSDIVGNGSFDVTMGTQPSDWGTSSEPAFSMSTDSTTPAEVSVASDRTRLQADAEGTVEGTITMTVTGATLAGENGDDLAATGLVEVTGLPAGVSATVTRTSGTTATVRVTGTLPELARTRFAVLLQDGALGDGVDVSTVTGTGLSVRDPYVIAVTDVWRARLRATYAEARLVVQGNYEGSTWAALVTARDSARTVLADATAGDAAINDADAALTAALDALALNQGGFRRLEAEKQDEWSGGSLGNESTGIGGVRPGSWIAFNGVSFGNGQVPDQVQVRYSGASNDGYANAAVQVRLGSPTGQILATVATPPTSTSFGTYAVATADLTDVQALLDASPAKLYFVFTGSNPTPTDTTPHWVGNFDYMQFTDSGSGGEAPDNNVVLTPNGRAEWGGDGVSVGSNTMKTETASAGAGGFTAIANTHNGDWVRWAGVDLTGGPTKLSVRYINNSSRVATDANLDVYLDSMSGTPMVNIPLPATGADWNSSGVAEVTLPAGVTGTRDVFIVMRGTYSAARPYIGNFGDLTFDVPDAPVEDGKVVELESRSRWTGPELKTESFSWNDGTSGTNVGGTRNGDVLEYDDVRLAKTATSVSVHYVNNSSRVGDYSRIEVYLGSRDGAPAVTVPLPVTGSTWQSAGTTTVPLPTAISGTQDVILVLRTTEQPNRPFVSNIDSMTFNYGVDTAGLQQLYDDYEPLLADRDRYVGVDFDTFVRAMDAAAGVLDAVTPIGSEVGTALRNLRLAGGQLAPRAQRSLMAAVTDAERFDLSRYTPESAAVLTSELADSMALLDAATASDEEYAAQADALETAITALVAKVYSAPAAPQAVSATSSGRTLTVAWAAPLSDGNSPLIGYAVQLEGGNPVSVRVGQTSYTFTGLVRGRSYRASVKAINALGVSPASAYTAYVPVASTVPDTPAAPGIAAVGQAVTVTWQAPEDGGSPITAQTVVLSDGTRAQVDASARSHTFTGVAAGDYTARVAATNVNGASGLSAASAVATVLPTPTTTPPTTPETSTVVAGKVTVKGKAKVGRTLRVRLDKKAWSTGTRFAVQWRVGGKVVGTGTKLKLKPRFAGKRVKVKVTGRIEGWRPRTVTTTAVRITR
jgi:predicted alpha-1,2-mannosidase